MSQSKANQTINASEPLESHQSCYLMEFLNFCRSFSPSFLFIFPAKGSIIKHATHNGALMANEWGGLGGWKADGDGNGDGMQDAGRCKICIFPLFSAAPMELKINSLNSSVANASYT